MWLFTIFSKDGNTIPKKRVNCDKCNFATKQRMFGVFAIVEILRYCGSRFPASCTLSHITYSRWFWPRFHKVLPNYSKLTKSWQPTYRCTFSENLKQKSHLFGSSLETAALTPTFHLCRIKNLLSNCSWQDFSPQLKIRGKYGLTQTVGLPTPPTWPATALTTICLLQNRHALVRLPPQLLEGWDAGGGDREGAGGGKRGEDLNDLLDDLWKDAHLLVH